MMSYIKLQQYATQMIQLHVNNMRYKQQHWLYCHGCSYIPGQFFRQKEVSFDVMYYRALHVFYNFKHSLHIVKLSSVKSTIMVRIPGCQAISPRLPDPWILIKKKAQHSVQTPNDMVSHPTILDPQQHHCEYLKYHRIMITSCKIRFLKVTCT